MNGRRSKSKYEIAPGLWIGSEIGDINQEVKKLIKKLVDGDDTVLPEINRLTNKKIELLKPKKFRDIEK